MKVVVIKHSLNALLCALLKYFAVKHVLLIQIMLLNKNLKFLMNSKNLKDLTINILVMNKNTLNSKVLNII